MFPISDYDTAMSMASSTALMAPRFGSSSRRPMATHSIWVSSRKVKLSFSSGFIFMATKRTSWYTLRKQKHIGLAPTFISRPWPTTNEASNFLPMCKFDKHDNWYWNSSHAWVSQPIKKYLWMRLSQVICDMYWIKSADIRNSPQLFQLCGKPISDYSVVITEKFLWKCITKKPWKMEFPKWIAKLFWLTKRNYNYGRERKLFTNGD